MRYLPVCWPHWSFLFLSESAKADIFTVGTGVVKGVVQLKKVNIDSQIEIGYDE